MPTSDNEMFEGLTAGLEDLGDESGSIDYTQLSLQHLLNLRAEIELKLASHGALNYNEANDDDRELQTRYYGLTMELRRRQGGHG